LLPTALLQQFISLFPSRSSGFSEKLSTDG
jgi:hypothetical protein